MDAGMSQTQTRGAQLWNRASQSPGVLLVACGSLLGLNFPLGRFAMEAGVSPFIWAITIAIGSAACLGGVILARHIPVRLDAHHLRYFAVTAVVSYALPNLLVFALIPRLGSGFTAVFFTLSPMLTVALAHAAKLRSPARLERIGVAVGFAGAVLVASARGETGRSVDWLWAAAGFLIPLSLATGNVYRTVDWPKNANPLWLAVGSNAFAAIFIFLLALFADAVPTASSLFSIPGVVCSQIAASACLFALFFRLQSIGGPVTLSQIGTVAAAVGALAGTWGFGERYPDIAWVGVAVIGVGIALTIRARLANSSQ